MKLKLLLLMFLASLSSFAQYTLIPDVNFENALISIGIDSGTSDGKVLTYNISLVTTLDVRIWNIADLTGIQDFVALKTLKISGNKITTLDVSKNTALTYLDCSNVSFVTGLDVSKNTALKELYCNSCNLTTLDISKNTALTRLECQSNQLTTLDISKNTALTNLFCPYNQFTTLNLSKNTALTNLICSYNQLTSLDVSSNAALIELRCHDNRLTTLDVSNHTALQELYCGSNQLITLDVSKDYVLKRLYCQSNQLRTLDVKDNVLQELNCQLNKLVSLNLKTGNGWYFNIAYEQVNFKNNPNLSCIQVDDIEWSNTYLSSCKDATASFSNNCPALALISSEFENKLIALEIDKDGENGSILLASITNVTTLDVSNSGITSLSGIEYFSKLETLNCQGNLLTSINVSSNLALKYLDCSKNLLSVLDVSKNTKLTELYCDGIVTTNKKINAKTSAANQLTALDVSKNVLLTKLSCSNNLIVSLDLSKNTLLTDVNCSNNKLTSLNLKNGNNSKLVNVNFKMNASQSCIHVDDVAYANANWSTAKDATAIYSKTACTLGIEDLVFEKLAVYPNPTKGELQIDNIVLEKASVYDVLGKLVTVTKFTNCSNTNSIDLSGFPKGIYYVHLESEGFTVVKKIIVK